MATIQFKRGLASGIPTLAAGEPGWTTDTNALYVGTGAGNVLIGPGGGYSDEEAQDAVGTILADSATVNFTYTDATPEITASVITQMSVTSDASGLKLSGDSDAPGNSKLYGTNGSGTKGWYDQPTTTIADGSVTYAKIQDVSATARLLGRHSAGAGDVEELRLGTGLALNTDLLYCTLTGYTTELAQDDVGGILTDSTTIDFTYNDGVPSITAGVINNSIGATQLKDLRFAQGRLTLTSGTPVTTSDVTAAATVYYTPFRGNLVSLYDGSKWVPQAFSELSLDLTAGGGTTGGKPHDLFVRLVAGTPTLGKEEWTSATARNVALVLQDGTWVKSGATDWLYLGTIYTTAGSQTEDSEARRCVWNAYNRVPRPMKAIDATDSWNYTTATWRQARASAANQVDYVCGLSEDPVRATVQARMSNSTGTTASAGVGVDSTSANSARLHGAGATGVAQTTTAFYAGFPGIGYHYLAWLEISGAVGTTVWYGDNGLTYWSHGMVAEVMA